MKDVVNIEESTVTYPGILKPVIMSLTDVLKEVVSLDVLTVVIALVRKGVVDKPVLELMISHEAAVIDLVTIESTNKPSLHTTKEEVAAGRLMNLIKHGSDEQYELMKVFMAEAVDQSYCWDSDRLDELCSNTVIRQVLQAGWGVDNI